MAARDERQTAAQRSASGQASKKVGHASSDLSQDVQKRLLLHYAARLTDAAFRRQTSVVRELLAARANPNVPAEDGRLPLHAAVFAGTKGVVKELLVARAEPNMQEGEKHGGLPVQIAAWQGHADVLKILLQAGAYVNKADGKGWTPLCSAAKQGHVSSVRALIEAGAQPTTPAQLVDRPPVTPLQAAQQSGNVEAVRLIREAKEDECKNLSAPEQVFLGWLKKRMASSRQCKSERVSLFAPVQELLAWLKKIAVAGRALDNKKEVAVDSSLENLNHVLNNCWS